MTADWTVLNIAGMRDIALKAAHSVAAEYANVVEAEDLHQDALILLASNAALIRLYHDSGIRGFAYTWLRSRLVDATRPLAYRHNRTIPLNNFAAAA